jgi:secondary thiamine-phosphate synthase enzyme
MTVKNFTISLNTQGNADMIDITDLVENRLKESSLTDGILVVFCPSSTSALTTIEYETGALNDFARLFDQVASPGQVYHHDQRWHDGNGHSHVRAALLGPSLTIPFINRKLTLGTWQQILYIDFDIRPRRRELVVQLVGE